MDSLVILILGVGLVRSDVAYRYNVPLTSYEVPFASVGGLNNDGKYHIEKEVFPTGDYFSVTPPSILSTSISSEPSILSTSSILSTPSPLFQIPIHDHTSFTGVENPSQHKLSVVASNTDNDLSQDSPIVNFIRTSGNQNIESSTPLTIDLKSSFGNENSQQVVDSGSNFQNDDSKEVQKHLYFFAAPDEPEEVRARIITPPPSPKKNVKVLFIKAPTFKTAPIHVPVLPQNEDKTLVYVLVKKPEEQTVVVPTPAPTAPPKPEVYFIKYKTQKEAEEAVSSIQSNQEAENQHHEDLEQNFNVYSRISSTEKPLFVPTPTVVSIPSSPTVLGGQNGLSGIHAPIHSLVTLEPQGGRIFSSDAITKYDGSSFGGSTTVSPLGVSNPDEFSGTFNVHQVYGLPKIRRNS